MSRSALLKPLRQACRRVEQARQQNLPLGGMFARETLPRPSRRQVLRGGLALGSAIAAAAFPRQRSAASSQTPVLIVGGGIAGLTAAYRLRAAGVPVEAIEARNRVGGRTHTISRALGTSSAVEMGAEFIDTSHTFLPGLAEELGLTIIDREESLAGNITESFFFEGRYLSQEELAREIEPLVPKMTADLDRMETYADYSTPDPVAIAIDNLSLSEYLAQSEISPLMRSIIESTFTNVFGIEPDELSPMYLLFTLGLGAVVEGEYQTIGESDERFYIQGGNGQVSRLLAEKIPEAIATNTVLEAITQTPAGRYRVALRSGSQTSDRTYDRVILALPFSVLRQIPMRVELPEVKQRAIAELSYGLCGKLIARFNEKVWRTRYQRAAYSWTDLSFQSAWESSDALAKPEDALITNFLGGRAASQIERQPTATSVPSFVEQFDRAFPGVKAAFLPGYGMRTSWINDPYSRGVYVSYSRGQWTEIYGSEGERVGNLFFAGEHTSLEYQGYMEGGCESGERVALEVLEDLGLKASAARQRSRWQHYRSARPSALARYLSQKRTLTSV